jgi:signal transduction histidine kinase
LPEALRVRRWESLEHKLPLLMTGVLLVVLSASLLLTHRTLSRSNEERARSRLIEAIEQVAGTAEASLRRRSTTLARAARDPVLRAAVESPGVPSLRAARQTLRGFVTPSDSGLPMALWDATGQELVSTSSDSGGAVVPRDIIQEVVRDASNDTSRVRFTSIYPLGDRMAFWGVAPLRRDGAILGYVAQQMQVSGAANASEYLRGLTGEPVTLYLRNSTNDIWALAPGTQVDPPTSRDTIANGVVYDRDGERMLATEARVEGSPWIFILEEPLGLVQARARETVTQLALLSVALMALGAALSWFIGRRITLPLRSLTVAAEDIARGEYSRRITVRGGDELARLGHSFNQMAEQIALSRRQLEERVEEARRSREEAVAANRAKSDFLAVMSHELRTPLNAIAGYTQLLEMGIHGEITDAQRDALLRIKRSQAHLLALINDVLSFAKIDAGQVEFDLRDVALGEVLAELETLVAPQLRAKAQHFDVRGCNESLGVRADRDKLRQILINLVSNAIKFTSEGGQITVECEPAESAVAIRVRDTGIGIPAERHRSIFEPFVQGGRALNRTDEGVGLGLAISRDLARGMGGDITVESDSAGSVFTVTLPPASDAKSAMRQRLTTASETATT